MFARACSVVAPALFWAWDYGCFAMPIAYKDTVGAMGAVPFSGGDLVFLVAQFALLIAVVLLRVSSGRNLLSRRTVVVSGVVLAVYTVLSGLLDPDAPQQAAVLVAMAVVAGGAVPPVAVALAARQTLEHTRLVAVVAGSFAIAYLVFLGVSCLPGAASWIVSAVLPLAAVALWVWGGSLRRADVSVQNDPQVHEMTDGDPDLHALPWPTLLAFAVACALEEFVALLAAAGSAGSEVGALVEGTAANVAFCLVVMVVAWCLKDKFHAQDAFFVVAPLVIGVLLVQVIDAGASPVASQLLHSTTMMLQVTLWTLLVQLVERKGLSPMPVFGVGLFVLSTVTATVQLTVRVLVWAMGAPVVALSSIAAGAVLVLACVLSALAFACGRDREADVAEGEAAACGFDGAREQWQAAVTRKLEAFSASMGLSPRETDVFARLLTGATAPRIGEELGLTTGTVKTHISHIYRKLLVNTRQQAIDVFDGFDAPSD